MKIKGKKVLVTGADGFIGSFLTEALVQMGCDVRALVMYNSFNHLGWLETMDSGDREKLDIVSGDIRDSQYMSDVAEGIDVIFHLAAMIAIPFSYKSPENFIDTNVKGTLNLLNAGRNHGVKKILVTSTSEVYGTALYIPIDEAHPLKAQSPYSASKIAAEKIAESYYHSFDLPVAIVRPFNTYGPRQSARAIIPTIITQLLDGKREIMLGDLRPSRDLVFVRDTVAGFIKIAESDKTVGTHLNIATGKEIKIGDLAEILIRMINPKAGIVEDEKRIRPPKSEVMRLHGSNKMLQSVTGWTPEFSLELGLAETVDWYRKPENRSRFKSGDYNI